jgi:hypothetical protein
MSPAIPAPVINLSEVDLECFWRPWISTFHKMEATIGLLQDLLYWQAASHRYLAEQSQLMFTKKPPEPLMVNLLASPQAPEDSSGNRTPADAPA